MKININLLLLFTSLLSVPLLVSGADSDMQIARANFIEISTKLCNKKWESNSNGLPQSYCSCTIDKLMNNLSDQEFKNVLLGGNRDEYNQKVSDAGLYCILSDPESKKGILSKFKSGVYDGCVKGPDQVENDGFNKEHYCRCASDNYTKDIPDDEVKELFEKLSKQGNLNKEALMTPRMLRVVTECMSVETIIK